MAFCTMQFEGPSIGKQASMNLIVPETGDGPFPTLYLLHGLSDDHTAWMRRTSIERYVEDMRLIVVMPNGHRSFYCNDPGPGGHAYEDHIVDDVVGFVDRTLPTVADRAGRAIAGISMGGYGAMMLAMRHPGVFSAACSHSGALAMFEAERPEPPAIEAVISGRVAEGYNCFRLAEQLKTSGHDLAIRIDCGVDDFLLDDSRAFHAHLVALGIGHVYEEDPGAHSWTYWDEHIRRTLAFVTENLGE